MPQLAIAIAIAIATAVVVKGVFAFVQEERAECASQRLSEPLPVNVVVIREGEQRSVDARRSYRWTGRPGGAVGRSPSQGVSRP